MMNIMLEFNNRCNFFYNLLDQCKCQNYYMSIVII